MVPRQRLTFCSVVANIVYSTLLLADILLAAVGLLTYAWIETTDDKMLEGDVYPPDNAPGLQKVSCGLVTYCIDAAGQVSDCSLPWPTFASPVTELDAYPSGVWAASAICIASGIGLLCLAWLYSVVACFGCFRKRVHRCCVRLVELAAACFLASLLCFGYALRDVEADHCRTTDVNGKCTSHWATLPSSTIEGAGNQSCKICPNGSPYQLSSTCSFGWGGIVIIAATVATLLASWFGGLVQPRKESWLLRALHRRRIKNGGGRRGRTAARSPSGGGARQINTVPPDNGVDGVPRVTAVDDTAGGSGMLITRVSDAGGGGDAMPPVMPPAAAGPAGSSGESTPTIIMGIDASGDDVPPPPYNSVVDSTPDGRPRIVQINPDDQYQNLAGVTAGAAAVQHTRPPPPPRALSRANDEYTDVDKAALAAAAAGHDDAPGGGRYGVPVSVYSDGSGVYEVPVPVAQRPSYAASSDAGHAYEYDAANPVYDTPEASSPVFAHPAAAQHDLRAGHHQLSLGGDTTHTTESRTDVVDLTQSSAQAVTHTAESSTDVVDLAGHTGAGESTTDATAEGIELRDMAPVHVGNGSGGGSSDGGYMQLTPESDVDETAIPEDSMLSEHPAEGPSDSGVRDHDQPPPPAHLLQSPETEHEAYVPVNVTSIV